MKVFIGSGILATLLGIGAIAPGPLSPQAPASTGAWVLPRTEHGHPDLQGNWTNSTLTPLERPAGFGPILTPEQVARIESGIMALRENDNQPSDPDRPPPPAGGDTFGLPIQFTAGADGTGGYNFVWIDPGEHVAYVDGQPRSSLITMPEDGRVPAVTEATRIRLQAERADRDRFGPSDHPELRSLSDRCILTFGSNAGPPMLPNGWYNNNYTIVQTADHVLILSEMIHDARIIRLGDVPRLPPHIRPWLGDSHGRWEGETLVVETTNFHPDQRFRGMPSDDFQVLERFTRIDDETILYEFAIDDPSVYAAPWGGQVPLRRLDGLLYEYACHEGNYSLANILSGARFEEARADRQDAPP